MLHLLLTIATWKSIAREFVICYEIPRTTILKSGNILEMDHMCKVRHGFLHYDMMMTFIYVHDIKNKFAPKL